MINAARLGGKLAAHGVWSVSEGATLIPIFGAASADSPLKMTRLALDDLARAVAEGKRMLEEPAADADDAALVYDARITLEGRKVDALILELRTYFMPGAAATLAIPYTPLGASSPFRVHRPKLIEWRGCEDFDVQTTFEAFWQGVDSHEHGAKIWTAALDPSL